MEGKDGFFFQSQLAGMRGAVVSLLPLHVNNCLDKFFCEKERGIINKHLVRALSALASSSSLAQIISM